MFEKLLVGEPPPVVRGLVGDLSCEGQIGFLCLLLLKFCLEDLSLDGRDFLIDAIYSLISY